VTNDRIQLGAGVTYGGVLNILPAGAFTNGQTFTLFSGTGVTNTSNFSSITGSPGSGLAFTFTNGVLSVIGAAPQPPLIAPVTLSGGSLSLQVPTISGYSYVLQSATNLLPPIVWLDETTNVGTGGTVLFNVPVITDAPQKFLRVRVD
jgi:hypothetical protein